MLLVIPKTNKQIHKWETRWMFISMEFLNKLWYIHIKQKFTEEENNEILFHTLDWQESKKSQDVKCVDNVGK